MARSAPAAGSTQKTWSLLDGARQCLQGGDAAAPRVGLHTRLQTSQQAARGGWGPTVAPRSHRRRQWRPRGLSDSSPCLGGQHIASRFVALSPPSWRVSSLWPFPQPLGATPPCGEDVDRVCEGQRAGGRSRASSRPKGEGFALPGTAWTAAPLVGGRGLQNSYCPPPARPAAEPARSDARPVTWRGLAIDLGATDCGALGRSLPGEPPKPKCHSL